MESLLTRRFTAVLFDLDGTLVDSTAAILRCWVTWAREEGVDPTELSHAHGVPAGQIITALVPPERVAPALARVTALELADTADISPLPGAKEAIAALPGEQTAIVTSCTRDLARARIAAAGLDVPDVVVTVDDVAHGKPAPDPFLTATGRLAAAPGDCLVVEDAPSGVAAARAAGCAVLAVTTTTAADLLDADLVVPDLSAVGWSVDHHGVGVHLTGPAGGRPVQ